MIARGVEARRVHWATQLIRVARLVRVAGATTLLGTGVVACNPPAPTTAPEPTRIDARRQDAFLDTLQQRTFQWFWDNTDARTGLTPDRWPSRTFSSVAAIGFALTAYPIGAERGYVTSDVSP